MIEFDNVRKVYPDGTVALKNISYGVERGTTTALVGPSGCGKTTSIELVNRLHEPTEGTIYFDGSDIQDVDKIDLRRNIGYVIQEIGLFDHQTVAENVGTVPDLLGWEQDRIDDRVDELLALVDLDPEKYRDQYPNALSGGQRQRVGVARALAADPDVMLMDEPFGALDPITRESLQDEFLEIQEQIETTILFVTHDIDEALKMGDQIAIYNVGEVVQYDTPENVLQNPANEFVESFIGDDRSFKLLAITQVKEVMTPVSESESKYADRFDPSTGKVVPDGGNEAVKAPSPEDSAKAVVSYFVETPVNELPVVEDGEIVGVVSEQGVRDHFQNKTGAF